MPRETIVGKIIIEKNTKILILLVLMMNLAVLFFNSSNYRSPPDFCQDDVDLLSTLYTAEETLPSQWNEVIQFIVNEKSKARDMPVIEYSIPNYGKFKSNVPRWDEELISCQFTIGGQVTEDDKQIIEIVLLNSSLAKYEALFNILRMIFFIITLFIGSCLFSFDANKMILGPMENLMVLVNLIAKNPELSEELIQLQIQQGEVELNEMKLVEYAILKLGTLLVLVFGQAGNNVIHANIANIHSEVIDVETIGVTGTAIFGFCDIRNFTDLTEILEEDIMVFVNTVAKLVHSTTIKYMGSANKNIGDAFLLVWSLPEECRIQDAEEEDARDGIKNNIFLERYAESALAACVDILLSLSQSGEVQEFAERPKVVKALPNFSVKMGFGLHYGWAIEGAIGSDYKIDASYLSPHVNMASRLEAATKQFGVPLLVSHQLHDLLSARTQAYCRLIDQVTVKGSEEPLRLYTINLDLARNRTPPPGLQNLDKINEQIELSNEWRAADVRKRYFREDITFSLDHLVPKLHLSFMKEEKFDLSFKQGVKYYISGNWKQAQILIENCLKLRPEDGPSHTLWNFMKNSAFICPKGWKGVRSLVEK